MSAVSLNVSFAVVQLRRLPSINPTGLLCRRDLISRRVEVEISFATKRECQIRSDKGRAIYLKVVVDETRNIPAA